MVIWLIEDDLMVRTIVHYHLSKSFPNYTIYQFTNGLEAYNSIKETKENDYIIIVLDLDMPIIDGFTFSNEIDKIKLGFNHRLILHSSLSRDAISKRMRYRMPYRVIDKLDTSGLIKAISTIQVESQ